MALHHILPRFILKGFCINPNDDKKDQKIMIYDRGSRKVNIEKINTAYAKENFNSQNHATNDLGNSLQLVVIIAVSLVSISIVYVLFRPSKPKAQDEVISLNEFEDE